ncbi:EamA family transporter [Candidatus Roizmanbacteria bacterium]|nr:EamA family transporter [Candidatus Roizmanbacteria bacterium]
MSNLSFFIYSIGTAFFFALTFVFRKLALKKLSPLTAYAIEAAIQIFILVVLVIFFLMRTQQLENIKSKSGLFALIAGITTLVAIFLNYFALKTGFLSKVVSVTSPSQIIFGVLLGLIIFQEKLTIAQMIGSLLAIIGIYLIVFK